MRVVVSYDVRTDTSEGRRRLRRIAKLCESNGVRVQYSVFECQVDSAEWVKMKDKIVKIINEDEDSVRVYFLGSNWQRKISHIGLKKHFDVVDDTLIL
ncbi:CRISPR-associated endonuclease Cas2 [Sediminispirochaeta smaragdinae]|uniref:CRISPR-associated endoribonuclease Cas2 n=1 Tax=Sediminispirochaeta smaragdinae (strain DSM 11293 / JCM 15392 / SEBR 4228) TaxID=573413 RepID=E1R0V9_SEDSS|nr:CRISPR-associated endonuclease Cas2 [Sediminispirochaeta smaragdinae]ADK80208.1 CRISPR-associated protein Cas2 [Sediminispirochaeta smaragdinae DSM 11293]